MLRFRRFVPGTVGALLAFMALLLACSGSSGGGGIPPITGIVIRAETLTTGRGCGRGPTQVFRYAAVVFDKNFTRAVDRAAGVYDCFTDGMFVDLPRTNDSFDYGIEVFIYNEAAYTAAQSDIETAGTDTAQLARTNATWQTRCTASQLHEVQSVAVCGALDGGPILNPSGEARILVRTSSFPRGSGPALTCATAAPDAGADGGGDGGGDADAGDAAPTVPAAFAKVRAVGTTSSTAPGDGGTRLEGEVACPADLVLANATAGARYDIAVTLQDVAGGAVGTTICTATAAAGQSVPATCQPVP